MSLSHKLLKNFWSLKLKRGGKGGVVEKKENFKTDFKSLVHCNKKKKLGIKFLFIDMKQKKL